MTPGTAAPPARRARIAEAVRQRTLANGARLFVLENRFNTTLAVSGTLFAGRLFAPPDRRLIASVTDSATPARTTLYTYDAANEHLIAVQGPDGLVTRYTYDTGDGAAREHALTSI